MARGFASVNDSGARQEFDTGSVRDTRDGKGRYDLLPPYSIERIAQHFENGARKYGDRNWQQGQPLTRYLDSALRHTFRLLDGQADEDHAAAAAWNLLAFIWTQHEIEAGRLPASLDDTIDQSAAIARAAEYVAPECAECEAADHGADCVAPAAVTPGHHTDCRVAYGFDSCDVCGAGVPMPAPRPPAAPRPALPYEVLDF
jgi:diadenosine tetraphosphatase ApaH/serine/threonine PP2A family protein phosphatase